MKTALTCILLCLAASAVAAAQAQPGSAPKATAQPLAINDSTTIEAIAAAPAGKVALDKYMPELLPHPAYEQFKGMSLRALAPLSAGIITDEKIAAVEAALRTARASGNAAALAQIAAIAPAAPHTDPACEAIGVGRRLGNAVVVLTEAKAAGRDTPAYCRVVAISRPGPGSRIVIETLLPARASWNGKLYASGNGGFAGALQPTNVTLGALRFGYAAAAMDMGTYPAGVGFNGGVMADDVLKDFGYRATRELAAVPKALAARYYGEAPRRAYYSGCSTGGQQGLQSAQRFPGDFDGIVAGAPAHNRTHLHIMFNQRWDAARDPATLLSPTQVRLWADQVERQCLPSNVTAPGDPFMASPQCKASPRKLLCKPGQDPSACLTEPQVRTLEILYGGLRNPRTSELISPAFPLGIERQFPRFIGSSGEFDMTRWVFGPDWDRSTFDYDKDVDRMDAKLAPIVNAMNPDLSRFAARGGKLIMFHGLEDTAISVFDTLDYFDRITGKAHRKSEFASLFLAPGMGHCAGGRGPSALGQASQMMTGNPETDILAALDRWVETGAAPSRIVATPMGEAKTGPRPLCPYPQVARYDGRGDVKSASSYACTPSAPVTYDPLAPRYRR